MRRTQTKTLLSWNLCVVVILGTLLVLTGCRDGIFFPTPPEPPVPPLPAVPQPPQPPDWTDPAPEPEPTDPSPTPDNGDDNSNADIFDPLTNGQSVGMVEGGEFTSEGFEVTTSYGGYIAYSTNIERNIRVEFDAKGYVSQENDGDGGKLVLLEIFDSSHDMSWQGEAWNSPYYMFHFRKRGLYNGQHHNKVDGVELKCGGRGGVEEYKTWEGHSPAGHPLEWNPRTTYHWVVTIHNGNMEITRNAQVIFAGACHDFNPSRPLNVRIGGVPYGGRTSPRNVTYSNVSIYRE